MADNLPLIPQKKAICNDVRSVLREVFRERDYLPPLKVEPEEGAQAQAKSIQHKSQWTAKYLKECEEIHNREGELREEHARRVGRQPKVNQYKLSSGDARPEAVWKVQRGLIARKDLVPLVEENAACEVNLWVKNILHRSSCDVSCLEVLGTRINSPISLPAPDEHTVESLSLGDLVVRRQPPPPPLPPVTPPPEFILCVPPKLEFVNFTVGQLHVQSLRLVNLSKHEIRLSLRPPSRYELDVVLCGPRGLSLTAGAATELDVRFTPRDVRVLNDTLLVRVSVGKSFEVPIHCYMQPPILELMVPNVTWSSLSCMPSASMVRRGGDILELGARLLGDVHCVRLLLNCDAEHASFFVLTEDAWLSYCLDTLTSDGSIIAGPFTISPAWWKGGGAVRGGAWCCAPHAGLHATALRVLASTGVARPLHMLADSLMFTPSHVTLEAHEKNYDICSEDDPACQYYVHLGTAFPNKSLSATVQLVNHSPIVYSYYWSVRPWGVCSCWEEQQAGRTSVSTHDDTDDSVSLCVGAMEARYLTKKESEVKLGVVESNAGLVRVEPARGRVAPRSSCVLHVCVPNVGTRLGVQRAVLMLILKDIPRESFPPDYDPMIVKTETITAEHIPGYKQRTREVCEVVCSQLEVWWEVVPVRFVLDPPMLFLPHSRRIKEVDLKFRATQLFGCESIKTTWALPEGTQLLEESEKLAPANSCAVTLRVALRSLPNEHPDTELFLLEAANDEWNSQVTLIRQCATRHPRLKPARVWFGIVPPRAYLTYELELLNDTHQHICWWGTVWRWHHENEPSAKCSDLKSCTNCHERACTCDLLRPSRGALAQQQRARLVYNVFAPDTDGCVATLIQVQRTAGDVAKVPGGAGTDARATLVFYRVLAPQLVLRVFPCHGNKVHGQCEGCGVDPGAEDSSKGTAVLRPSFALTVDRCSCYRLRFTNITPLPTTVIWEKPIDKEEFIQVKFIPNDFDVASYGQVEISVLIKARKVCSRQIFVYRAKIDRGHKPLYLVIDAAVSGLEVLCEIPLGGDIATDSSLIMRNIQKEQSPWEDLKLSSLNAEEIFAEEDRKRAVQTENICHCPFKMMYIPKVKTPKPPRAEDDPPSIEILWEPPPFTRVCPCSVCAKPVLPEHEEKYCLQFKNIPLKTVRTRTLVLHNESILTAKWKVAVRNWPRVRSKVFTTSSEDSWSADVKYPGVAIQVTPSGGLLMPRARLEIVVSVFADCWGLYYDQILLMIEKLEPIVIDVWMEVVGSPLQLVMKLEDGDTDNIPTLWISSSDPERTVRIKNTSRSELVVYTYILRENAHPKDVLPFRLYLRFFDTLPRTCPCVNTLDSLDELSYEESDESLVEEMDTGIEILLLADHGIQEDTDFQVEQEVMTVGPKSTFDVQVSLCPPDHGDLAPNCTLLIRPVPSQPSGPSWYRRDPDPREVRLQQTERDGQLRVSPCKIRVKFCALDLPRDDVLRIRKSIAVQNVGNGHLYVRASTRNIWSIVEDVKNDGVCGTGCVCVSGGKRGERTESVELHLEPRSCKRMSVEVCIKTSEAWPNTSFITDNSKTLPYPEKKKTVTPLWFYDNDNVLMTAYLILEMEYPILKLEPSCIDFGFVTDGDSRKTYFTVSHSSRTSTLDLVAEWHGSTDFVLHPKVFRIQPWCSQRVCVQYTSRWRGGSSEGFARVMYGIRDGAGSWCRAELPVRAATTRDFKCHAAIHDHTDDGNLLPPGLDFL